MLLRKVSFFFKILYYLVIPIIEDHDSIKDSQILDVFCDMLGASFKETIPDLKIVQPLQTPPELALQREKLDKMFKEQQKLQSLLEKLSAENEKKIRLVEPIQQNIKISIEVKSDMKDVFFIYY